MTGLYIRLGIAGVIAAAVVSVWLYIGHLRSDAVSAQAKAAQWQSAAAGYQLAYASERTAYALSDKTATAYADASGKVQIQTQTILKEVTKYVTPETDARCLVPVGLVRLYNAAASGSDPASVSVPSGLSDGSASGISCSELASDITDNFGLGRQNAEQLKAIQSFVLGASAITDGQAKIVAGH